VVWQTEMIARLEAKVAVLEADNAELKRQLKQNSRSSSKPPSTDSPLVKPPPKSLRRKSGREAGGQPGHPGSTLSSVDNPQRRFRHEPGPCGVCGCPFSAASTSFGSARVVKVQWEGDGLGEKRNHKRGLGV
jgi:transposase